MRKTMRGASRDHQKIWLADGTTFLEGFEIRPPPTIFASFTDACGLGTTDDPDETVPTSSSTVPPRRVHVCSGNLACADGACFDVVGAMSLVAPGSTFPGDFSVGWTEFDSPDDARGFGKAVCGSSKKYGLGRLDGPRTRYEICPAWLPYCQDDYTCGSGVASDFGLNTAFDGTGAVRRPPPQQQ